MIHFVKIFIYIRIESYVVFSYFLVVLKMQNHIFYEIRTENYKEIEIKTGEVEIG